MVTSMGICRRVTKVAREGGVGKQTSSNFECFGVGSYKAIVYIYIIMSLHTAL